jgi:hypothetical protein
VTLTSASSLSAPHHPLVDSGRLILFVVSFDALQLMPDRIPNSLHRQIVLLAIALRIMRIPIFPQTLLDDLSEKTDLLFDNAVLSKCSLEHINLVDVIGEGQLCVMQLG